MNKNFPNSTFRRSAVALLLAAFSLLAAKMMADEPKDKAPSSKTKVAAPRFETHIAPIFKANCLRCHNAQAMKAELDLSTPGGLFKGGESGPAVVPGDLEESLLYEMVHEGEMPPEDDKRLTKDEVETIRRWIEAGTPFTGKINPRDLVAAAEVNNHDIEPLLRLRCTVCHGLRRQEGGLDLRTKASMLKGGKSGPAIVLGKPEESRMIKKIRSGAMPPNKRLITAGVRPVTSGELEKLARWIELNAPEVHIKPDVARAQPDPLVTDEDRKFWAFQSPGDVKIPRLPREAGGRRCRNPIDAFILRKLRQHGLSFSPEASKLTLMRRAYFDLSGLPPEPEEVIAYLADDDPLAYDKLIDRLLDSSRYGERWGRYWLDLAGYADSEGKRSADPVRPNAWKYRDYIIRSFNADKPYDRMLLEQIAGDELADWRNAKQITPELIDNLIATGFLRMAPDGTGSDVVNRVPERLEVISDEIDILSSSVLGLTMKCARCHSHKYDPIPQRDYYRLVDILKGAFDEHDWLKPAFVPGQTKAKKPGRILVMATEAERKDQKMFNRDLDRRIAAEKAKLKAVLESLRNIRLEEQLAQLPLELRQKLRKTIITPAEKRDAGQKSLAKQYEKLLRGDDAVLKRSTKYKAAARNSSLRARALEGQKLDEPQIRALWDRGTPSPTYIYRRGDHLQPGRLVGPGVPSVLTNGKTPFVVKPPRPGAKSTGRRLALARWLVRPSHPLTARVMINRVWKHHFGQGIVKSLGNFGKLGARPTHPDLLDWLAREFVRRRWSLKQMHRLMMTSTAYRQSSAVSEDLLAKDEDNSLLSRMPLQRLDAEALRDSLLLLAGKLNERSFGRPDSVGVRSDGLVTAKAVDGGWRRSIYIQHRRKEILTVLETFDQPQMNPNCHARTTSTVVQQALYLMNNALVRQLSDRFAERVLREATTRSEQIERVYLIALSRPPTKEERDLAQRTLSELFEAWSAQLDAKENSSDEVATRALATFCHTIMNSAAFVYVD